MGLRAKGYIGYSNYYYTIFRDKFYDEYDGSYDDGAAILNAHGIQYGAELAYIWDFLDKGKHTIGLDIAPLGLAGSTYFGKVQYKSNGATIGNVNIKTHTKFAYTASIGLHYYYNVNHQIFASYKIRTYSTTATANLGDAGITKISNVSNHAFLLGYAYKF